MTTARTVTDALAPCPFCGGAGSLWPDDVGSGGQHVPPYHAGCPRPGCGFSFMEEMPEDAIAAWNRRTLSPAPLDDPDEAYELGKRDGYEDAVQDLDIATGGDGEFRYCTDHDPNRHCPDVETMKARIVERLKFVPAVLEAMKKQRTALSPAPPVAGTPVVVDIGKAIEALQASPELGALLMSTLIESVSTEDLQAELARRAPPVATAIPDTTKS